MLCEQQTFAQKSDITLNTIAIPRSINAFADSLSRLVNYEDYSVMAEFFHQLQNKSGMFCNIDRFANNLNTKCPLFNSSSMGSCGVDAFKYDWGKPYVNWLS